MKESNLLTSVKASLQQSIIGGSKQRQNLSRTIFTSHRIYNRNSLPIIKHFSPARKSVAEKSLILCTIPDNENKIVNNDNDAQDEQEHTLPKVVDELHLFV